MLVAYDLEVCPPTFDVITFLSYIERLRLESHPGEKICVKILPGPVGGFRQDVVWPKSIAERVQLRDHVLEPLCWLLPSVLEVQVLNDRNTMPLAGARKRWMGMPFYVKEALHYGMRPLRCPVPYVWNPKLVTITLREAAHHPKRNSNLKEWLKAAQRISAMGYRVCFIRDTIKAREPLPFETSSTAALDIIVRSELYAGALLNMGVNNGPMWMATAMNAAVMMIKPTTEMGSCYDKRFFAKLGIIEGANLPTSPRHQQLVWAEDDADSIMKGFERMLPCLIG